MSERISPCASPLLCSGARYKLHSSVHDNLKATVRFQRVGWSRSGGRFSSLLLLHMQPRSLTLPPSSPPRAWVRVKAHGTIPNSHPHNRQLALARTSVQLAFTSDLSRGKHGRRICCQLFYVEHQRRVQIRKRCDSSANSISA